MLQAVLIGLVVSLFVYQVAFFRRLTKKQVNQIMRTFVIEVESTSRIEKVVAVPSQKIAIQESVSHIKK